MPKALSRGRFSVIIGWFFTRHVVKRHCDPFSPNKANRLHWPFQYRRGEITLVEYVVSLDKLGNHDVERVGGKNASLGEMISNLAGAGVSVPGGFATTRDTNQNNIRTVVMTGARAIVII